MGITFYLLLGYMRILISYFVFRISRRTEKKLYNLEKNHLKTDMRHFSNLFADTQLKLSNLNQITQGLILASKNYF